MLISWWINRLERQTGEDLTYAREIATESRGGFLKLALMMPAISHVGRAPLELHHLARLGALLWEDCGPCVQTQVKEAMEAGVSAELLESAVRGPEHLDGLTRDAFLFGRGVAANGMTDEAVRKRLREAFGPTVLVDLTIAAASVRVFPALKRGLGYAQSCAVTPPHLYARNPTPDVEDRKL